MKKSGHGLSERCGYINIIFNKFDLDGGEKAKKEDHCVWSRKKASGRKGIRFVIGGTSFKTRGRKIRTEKMEEDIFWGNQSFRSLHWKTLGQEKNQSDLTYKESKKQKQKSTLCFCPFETKYIYRKAL